MPRLFYYFASRSFSYYAGPYYYVNWIEDLCKKYILAYILALWVFMVSLIYREQTSSVGVHKMTCVRDKLLR